MLTTKLIALDYFARDFELKVSKEKRVFGTLIGSVMTLAMGMILIFYGGIQFHRLIHYRDPDVMTSSRDSYFDMDFVFPNNLTSKKYSNFDLAFSLTGPDGTKLTDNDPRYGGIKARYASWDLGTNVRYKYID